MLMEEELQRIDRRMSCIMNSLQELSLSPDLQKQGTLKSMQSMLSTDTSTANISNGSVPSDPSTQLGSRDDIKSNGSENVDYPKLIQLVLGHCIEGVYALPMEQRIYDNLVPLHCAVVFRCFVEWDVFNENENNTALMLQRYIDYVTVTVQDEDRMRNDLETSYWMIRMAAIIYWVQLLFPLKFAKKRKKSPGTESRSRSNSKGPSKDKDSTEEIEDESDGNPKSGGDLNLQCWFVQKLTGLAGFCFDNIMANLIEKLSRIPFDFIFGMKSTAHSATDRALKPCSFDFISRFLVQHVSAFILFSWLQMKVSLESKAAAQWT